MAVAGQATELDEINRATVIAYATELQATLSVGGWSTAKPTATINELCDTKLATLTAP